MNIYYVCPTQTITIYSIWFILGKILHILTELFEALCCVIIALSVYVGYSTCVNGS